MYFTCIKDILEQGIADYIALHHVSKDEVLSRMKSHLDHTQNQHFQPGAVNPSISYDDPLCRLAYLFRHAGINATLFERVLNEDQVLQNTIANAADSGTLKICSLGGGPGTELLGLAKFLLQPRTAPRRIDFAVLDNVYHWAETWDQLAKGAENVLEAELGSDRPTVSQGFLPVNVFDPSSYDGFISKFKEIDIVVCNYLFSENKDNLVNAKRAIARLNQLVSEGCTFVVIDRHENDSRFVEDVAHIFESNLGPVEVIQFNGIMDSDEQKSEFGAKLLNRLGNPRLDFRTYSDGRPRAFWFTAQKQGLHW